MVRGVQRRACPSTTRRVQPGRRPALRPAAPQGTGGQYPHPHPHLPALGGGRVRGATRGVTPRQACPRPDSLGRNLRSKTRWFTGFCNSHQVSHFATFFIDARAKISVAESRKVNDIAGSHRAPFPPRRSDAHCSPEALFLGAHRARCCSRPPPRSKGKAGAARVPRGGRRRATNVAHTRPRRMR